MNVKNILIAGAVGVLIIYMLGNQQKKEDAELQNTQYGGYGTDPQMSVATESGVYRV